MALIKKRLRPRKGPLPFRYVFLISFVIFIILTVQGLWFVERGIRPTLLAIAHTETQRIATLAINDAISKKISESTEMEELIVIDKDAQGNITSARFDPTIYNKVLYEATYRVQHYLKMVEEGRVEELGLPNGVEVERNHDSGFNGIIHTIPLGQATQNALLAHLGPQIPVRFTAIGDVKSQINNTIKEVGINNTWIDVAVDIEVDVRIIIPFATDTAVVSTSIPVGMLFVPGKVPDFYNQGGSGSLPAPAIIKESDIREAIN
ncbi:sporulation protein YunB [Anaerobacillus sp. MEB173]|uniref:sporulation protein YunB n=1 Tax=Anaerobacillus sp. MEB173 TaxID=3383345 RepID=UPI003F939168